MFTAIHYVTSGLSLAAFIVAAIFYAYRENLKHRVEIIRSAPPKERIEAIDATANFLRINTSDLNSRQKERIIISQLEFRRQRDKMIFVLALFAAFMLALLSIFGFFRHSFEAISRAQVRSDRITIGILPNAEEAKRSGTFCIEPKHGGDLVVGSGSVTNIDITGQPNQTVLWEITVDTAQKICVEIVLYKGAKEWSVGFSGVLVATEQYYSRNMPQN